MSNFNATIRTPAGFAKRLAACAAVALAAAGGAWAAGKAEGDARARSVAVFVPGVVSGSPIYEMLVAGARRAVEEEAGKATLTVVEGGFNQAEWEAKLTSLAASGAHDLIVSSNPAIPAICAAVSAKFPAQRFLLLDGKLEGNPRIYTLRYNQREQAYLAGYIAGLATSGGVPGANAALRVGLVAGQEYPAMNAIILPGYREGAAAAAPGTEVDFRVVGNWFDAAKGAELAGAMIRGGSDVILAIAGGANQGVLRAAADAGAKVVWFDVNGYAQAPGVVVGSAVLRQEKAAYAQVKRFLDGTLPFGKAEIVGMAEGYVDFEQDDPLYAAAVSEAARAKLAETAAAIKAGRLALPEE